MEVAKASASDAASVQSKPSVYIAGPMRGHKWFNFPAFDRAAQRLELRGYHAINPADLDRNFGFDPFILDPHRDWDNLDEIGFDLHDAIHRDIEALKKCDSIYMLKGWRKSKGAKAERQLAIWMGLEVIYEDTSPKIFVCGHGRHGKDTVGNIMKDEFGLKGESSSHFVAKVLVRQYLEDRYSLFYKSLDECYADRIHHRSKWYDAIREYNKDDPTRLSRDIFSENNLYIGIRNREEFLASKFIADLSVWVDASDRIGPEDESSCTILPEDCDIVISNNGSHEDLKDKVRSICSMLML